jgi:hypothetical protein
LKYISRKKTLIQNKARYYATFRRFNESFGVELVFKFM